MKCHFRHSGPILLPCDPPSAADVCTQPLRNQGGTLRVPMETTDVQLHPGLQRDRPRKAFPGGAHEVKSFSLWLECKPLKKLRAERTRHAPSTWLGHGRHH